MKITVTTWGEGYESSGVRTEIETTQQQYAVEFSDGEPEDMVIARDLNDAKKIWKIVELAYYAGKNGEEIEVIHTTEEED